MLGGASSLPGWASLEEAAGVLAEAGCSFVGDVRRHSCAGAVVHTLSCAFFLLRERICTGGHVSLAPGALWLSTGAPPLLSV